tara:strand:+ start:1005 stop:1508 length:504 start_codon:yes stop_codon:yes gene_type:complete
MKRKSFTLNPSFCFIDTSFKNPKSECLFDFWSIHHFYWQGFCYIILHHLFNIKSIKQSMYLCGLLSILHAAEEYFGNIGSLSLEGIVIDNIGPLVDTKIDPKLRGYDNDYLDNSIGDVLSGIISCILIIIYWRYYKKLPYLYLYGVFIILYLLLQKAYMLYPKNNDK